ncbi:HLA class II histocompatibility antigen gamma chain-like isoform X1 [Xyrauchen texanus]|uniref:HLA class II histocompatibility antigen gamma chain-like isoform X1 n=1 Tax=Xyrauchen texanus TaxID=154827 RepID=UPI0022419131|nr:HLA class II histocompatibility antigen gamma chain-like isoform X1 [Xyrauchen texanus]
MPDQQSEYLIQRAPSVETIMSPGSSRNANGKALKVAGFTVLACLLLAGQALTAYFVWGQREHISALSEGQEKLKSELKLKMSAGAPKVMQLPMNSLPLLKDYSDETSDKKQSVPLMKLHPAFLYPGEGSGLVEEASRLMPKRIHHSMMSMPLLTDPEEEVKGTPAAALELESRCQLESVREVRPGFFRPQCDEQGNYLPMQCWHSTGYCWCVDKDGTEIEGTRIKGRPQCGSE